MSPDRSVPGTAEHWLARANSDLALARVPLPPGAFYEDLCFHAQQAAEKAIKAVYARHGWVFRNTHDLGELLNGLVTLGLEIPHDVREAESLTVFASESRYPSLSEPVNAQEYDRAPRLAQVVVQWAKSQIDV